MPRPLDDLGPDFDRRWKQAPRTRRRELIAELRDLYLMLEEKDRTLLARLRGGRPGESPAPLETPPVSGHRAFLQQASLFSDGGEPPLLEPSPPPPPVRDNPFLPRSVLDRLQENRNRTSAGLRDLVQNTAGEIARRAVALDLGTEAAPASSMPPPSHEQSDLERELRLKLGPVVENLIEAQMEALRNELRVRLRLEMDRLIAEHVRK